MNWATILVPQIRRRRAVAVAAEFIIFALNGPLPLYQANQQKVFTMKEVRGAAECEIEGEGGLIANFRSNRPIIIIN